MHPAKLLGRTAQVGPEIPFGRKNLLQIGNILANMGAYLPKSVAGNRRAQPGQKFIQQFQRRQADAAYLYYILRLTSTPLGHPKPLHYSSGLGSL